MKKNKLNKLLLIGVYTVFLTSCSDDNSVTPGIPTNLNVIELVGTVSTTSAMTAEGEEIEVTVTIPQSFSSDVDVEVTALLNNGAATTTAITVPAGTTTGTDDITLPGDDATDSGNLDGLPNYGSLTLSAILLSELEEGNAYTISSAPFSLQIFDVLPDTDDGLNFLMDWENPTDNDLDMYILSTDGGSYEQAESGSRYEADLFQYGRPDGDYEVYVGFFVASGDIPYRFFVRHPDGTINIFSGTFPQADVDSGYAGPYLLFTQTTDPETDEFTFTVTQP